MMHAEIYKAYPQATAVVHTHSDHCVAISCLRQSIPPFHYMLASFGGDDVRCADYAPFGSAELARAAVWALEGRSACLLDNHGAICFAESVQSAMTKAVKRETLPGNSVSLAPLERLSCSGRMKCRRCRAVIETMGSKEQSGTIAGRNADAASKHPDLATSSKSVAIQLYAIEVECPGAIVKERLGAGSAK
jgi:hypothetical protein